MTEPSEVQQLKGLHLEGSRRRVPGEQALNEVFVAVFKAGVKATLTTVGVAQRKEGHIIISTPRMKPYTTAEVKSTVWYPLISTNLGSDTTVKGKDY